MLFTLILKISKLYKFTIKKLKADNKVVESNDEKIDKIFNNLSKFRMLKILSLKI